MNKETKINGKSCHIDELNKFIEKAAKIDVNLLILGETGVGKELAARTIHLKSKRKSQAFIKINCANLNENLLESDLFGYKKGSFTGAIIDKPGLLEEGNGGTVFLDEIADMTPYIQAKLLAVIEDREIRRLGENKTRKIDVRFIFATNKDLAKLVEKERFRKDLYYRICVLLFSIVPLKERKEDIPLIIEAILKEESIQNNKCLTIQKEAIEKLIEYSFPGNIRELENIIRRAAVYAESGIIGTNDIQFLSEKRKILSVRHSRFSTREIVNRLIKNAGNKTKTANDLGMSRRHIYRLINFDK
jgi:Nif-specific regulatory protein